MYKMRTFDLGNAISSPANPDQLLSAVSSAAPFKMSL